MRIHKRTEHNAVQRQLRLCLTLVYADYVQRTFVQHIDTTARFGQNSQPRSLNCEIPFIEKMTGLTKEEVESIS